MKRFGVLLAGVALVVFAAGCEFEGEAVAGTLDGREPAAVESPATTPAEAAGCGGGCGGGKAYGDDFGGGGCGDSPF